MKCRCWINHGQGNVEEIIQCSLCKSAPYLYKALIKVYQDIELQNVVGGSDELNLLVGKAIATLD